MEGAVDVFVSEYWYDDDYDDGDEEMFIRKAAGSFCWGWEKGLNSVNDDDLFMYETINKRIKLSEFF